MKPECWTAVRGASGRDFSKISPKPAPLSVLSWEGGVARGALTVECIVASVNRHSWNAHGEELYLIIRTITSHIKFRTRNVNHSPTYTLAQSVLLHHSPLWEGSSRTLTLMSL